MKRGRILRRNVGNHGMLHLLVNACCLCHLPR
jgi:hypothetical protein